MECSFCPNVKLPRKREVLAYETFEKLINNIITREITTKISFTGNGEPTLDPLLQQRLEHCHKSGLCTQLTTNGLRLKSVVKYLEFIDILFVSWQTANEETFSLRNANGWTYDLYVENILEFVKYVTTRIDSKAIIYISLMSNSHLPIRTKQIISDFYLALTEQDDRSMVEAASKIISVAPEKALVSLKELPNYIKNGVKKGVRQFQLMGNIFLYSYQFFNWGGLLFENRQNLCRKPKVKGDCQLFFDGPQILANGDVAFCCIDAFGSTTFGNIQGNELNNILKSEIYMSAFKNFKKGVINHDHCQRCLGEWRKNTLIEKWL
jgi:hypothetical protein